MGFPASHLDKTNKLREVTPFLAQAISRLPEAHWAFALVPAKLGLLGCLWPLHNQEGQGQLRLAVTFYLWLTSSPSYWASGL